MSKYGTSYKTYEPIKRFTNKTYLKQIRRNFSRSDLAAVCELPEDQFLSRYPDLQLFDVPGAPVGEDYFYYLNRGSNILAVAHLDTVGKASTRACHFVDTQAGPVVFSRALDDRLGAYTILDLLPRLGINVDVLLTVGEETGNSTAAYFKYDDHQYDWMIEFDRGGTDVVMYQYDTPELRDLLRASGVRPGDGIFSDIAELDHLGIAGFNWGIGYRDYHYANAHAYLNDTFDMIAQFMRFHANNGTSHLPYVKQTRPRYSSASYGMYGGWDWDEDVDGNPIDVNNELDGDDESRLDAWLAKHAPAESTSTSGSYPWARSKVSLTKPSKLATADELPQPRYTEPDERGVRWLQPSGSTTETRKALALFQSPPAVTTNPDDIVLPDLGA